MHRASQTEIYKFLQECLINFAGIKEMFLVEARRMAGIKNGKDFGNWLFIINWML